MRTRHRVALVIAFIFVVSLVIALTLPTPLPPIRLRPMSRSPCSTALVEPGLLVPELSIPVDFGNRGLGDYIFSTFVISADRDADMRVVARTSDGANATVASIVVNPTGETGIHRLSSVVFRVDFVGDSEATYVLTASGDTLRASFASNSTEFAEGDVTFDFYTGVSTTAWNTNNTACVVSRAGVFSRYDT